MPATFDDPHRVSSGLRHPLWLEHAFPKPSTEKSDAHVFLGMGPAFLLGAVVSGLLALRAWRSRRPPNRAAEG